MTSMSSMYNIFSSIFVNFTTDIPIELGLFGALVANTPCIWVSRKGVTIQTSENDTTESNVKSRPNPVSRL